MKVFSKEKFIEDCIKNGFPEEVQHAVDIWARRVDGQKVVDGHIRFVDHKWWLVHRKRRDREVVIWIYQRILYTKIEDMN